MSYYHSHFKDILDNSKQLGKQYGYYVGVIKRNKTNISNWLDLGCSRGDFLGYVNDTHKLKTGIGVDIDEDSITEAKKRNDTLTFHNLDIINFMKTNNKKFDVITCLNVLEHLETSEILTVIRLVPKHLKKGGVFFFKVPNAGTTYNNRWLHDDITHLSYLTNRSLKQLFALSNCNLSHFTVFEDSSHFLSKIGKIRFIYFKLLQLLSIFNYGFSHVSDPQTPTILGLYKK